MVSLGAALSCGAKGVPVWRECGVVSLMREMRREMRRERARTRR